MSGKQYFFWVLSALVMIILCGCQKNPRNEVVATSAYQVRIFDTGDKAKTLRSVVVALQDLDFIIDDANVTSGYIVASTVETNTIKIVVTVRQVSSEQVVVSAHASSAEAKDPGYYQSFFDVLARVLSLAAHAGDEPAA